MDHLATIADRGRATGEGVFNKLEEAYARVVASAGVVREFVIELAGLRICLQCPGGELLDRIGNTLAHLETRSAGAVDFTICCWDAEASGVEAPLPERAVLEWAAYGCLKLVTDRRYRTFHLEWAGIFSCVDLESHTAYCCYDDAERLSMYEVSGPLRAVFGSILNRHGSHLVHAAAVGTERGSLLFAGPPGSGKSTLAIQCLQAGLGYQSDDLCVLTSESRPRSLSIYNIAKLREDGLPRFPRLQSVLSHFEEEDGERKAYFYVHRHFPDQVLKAAPVRAILLPSITGEAVSRVERAAPMDAVRGVITWSVKEIPKSDNLGERIMLQAVSRLPAYRLYLGREEQSTMDLVRSLLDDR